MSALVKGHTLRCEGAPFERIAQGGSIYARRLNNGGVSGTGRALCSCGATSDVLESGGARKQWHREHKAAVS